MAVTAPTSSVLLADGRVLLLHGTQAEFFDPVLSTFEPVPAGHGYSMYEGTLLANGNVFLFEGNNSEILNPLSGVYTSGPFINAE